MAETDHDIKGDEEFWTTEHVKRHTRRLNYDRESGVDTSRIDAESNPLRPIT